MAKKHVAYALGKRIAYLRKQREMSQLKKDSRSAHQDWCGLLRVPAESKPGGKGPRPAGEAALFHRQVALPKSDGSAHCAGGGGSAECGHTGKGRDEGGHSTQIHREPGGL